MQAGACKALCMMVLVLRQAGHPPAEVQQGAQLLGELRMQCLGVRFKAAVGLQKAGAGPVVEPSSW